MTEYIHIQLPTEEETEALDKYSQSIHERAEKDIEAIEKKEHRV